MQSIDPRRLPVGRFPNEHVHDVEEDVRDEFREREARAARQASGYKVRWRIAWSPVIAAAILGGLFLLLLLLLLHG